MAGLPDFKLERARAATSLDPAAEVRVEQANAVDMSDTPQVGDKLRVRAFVHLGALRPDEVSVQLVCGRASQADLTLNLTGFWAKAQDTNVDPVTSGLIARDYKATGLEFEGGYRKRYWVTATLFG